jgi:hypothetical protein
MTKEEIVVDYIIGTKPVPDYMRPMVEKYNQFAAVADDVPQVDAKMNALFDAMVVLAQ